eukprot:scaffold4044_cov399-Prasinococcus_capsulatus_cf.AAC.4
MCAWVCNNHAHGCPQLAGDHDGLGKPMLQERHRRELTSACSIGLGAHVASTIRLRRTPRASVTQCTPRTRMR